MHMKILYVGNFFDGTGYSTAAINYVLAMDEAGIDVVPISISFNGQKHPVPERLIELLAKPSAGCDVVIQHTLPHLFEYNGNFRKNIGLFAWETSGFPESNWVNHLNLMDEVWVINQQMYQSLVNQGVKVP